MLHFDGQFLSIKKAMFAVKRGEYFRKYNIFEVDFESGVYVSMGCIHEKRIHYFPPKFFLQTSIFVQKSLKMGQNGPLYREICITFASTDICCLLWLASSQVITIVIAYPDWECI